VGPEEGVNGRVDDAVVDGELGIASCGAPVRFPYSVAVIRVDMDCALANGRRRDKTENVSGVRRIEDVTRRRIEFPSKDARGI
jgi:hypothetical protein